MTFVQFSIRLILATLGVAAFFVVTQALQIFPGVIPGLFERKGVRNADLPKDVHSTFLTTTSGAKVELWELAGKEQAPLAGFSAIVFHGNAETLDTFLDFLRWLASLGVRVYAAEYRGFGRSSGWPSEAAIYDDASMIWSFVNNERGVSADKLILVGRSIGSGPASFLAAKIHPRILVLLAPYRSIPDLVNEMFLFRYLRPFLWYEFPVERYLSSLKNTSVIIAHGEQDNIIAVNHGRYLADKIRNNTETRFILSRDAGHNDLMSYIEVELRSLMQDRLLEQ